eukprot:TRINITY_DN8008_c0_g2_i1.p1 TRINITY_DN8008_c0_g2~~TRINITY_DN8008_c0_g2_i1.p1  ORF type:complete len:331 (+),score=36.02 TRINITY_DN8008_c0_g2_i1:359-1351(+)
MFLHKNSHPQGTYREAVEDNKSKFEACFNTTKALEIGQVLLVDFAFRGNEGNCFDTCLSIGLNELDDDEELRTPGDAMLAMYTDAGGKRFCACVLDYPGSTQDSSCNKTMKQWDIPLYCAGIDDKECGLMPNCEYSSECCYYRGTVPEHPLWKASRIVLQWVFLSVAMVFIIQVIIYSVFKVRGGRRGFGYGSDLAVRLVATADQYNEMLDSLPTAVIPPGDTGTACTICLEDLAVAGAESSSNEAKHSRCVSLPMCKHTFHLTCIKSYVAHEATKMRTALCPNCRTKILPTDDDDEEQGTPENNNNSENSNNHNGRRQDEHTIELQHIQ